MNMEEFFGCDERSIERTTRRTKLDIAAIERTTTPSGSTWSCCGVSRSIHTPCSCGDTYNK
jgi:hypothetical protein